MHFSIVIPLYNKAEYISKTLSSVLAQTYPYFEVIVVDDGSTDNSLKVVKTLEDERIKIITQKNKGVSAARNTGINAAKYELIAFLDADDWWDSMYLEIMVSLIQEYPNVSIYSSQSAIIHKGITIPTKNILSHENKTDCFDYLQFHAKTGWYPLNSSCAIFRKNILQVSGTFDERISCCEDFDFFLRIGIYSKLAYIENGPLSFYNKDVEATKRATGGILPIQKHLLNYIDKYNEYYEKNEYLKYIVNQLILNRLFLYQGMDNYSYIKKQLLKGIDIKQFSLKHLLVYYVIPNDFFGFILHINWKLKGINSLNVFKVENSHIAE